jgi:hypothetical protein
MGQAAAQAPFDMFTSHGFHQVAFSALQDPMLHSIAQFLISKAQQIGMARAQKGGWEGWLQVELAIALQTNFGAQYTIEREQPIFTNAAQRVDIWAIPQGGQPTTHPFLGIELKVESAFQTGAQGGLVARYGEDIRKCSLGPRQTLRAQHGTALYAVGVTSLATDLHGYQQVANENRGDFYWTELVPGSLYMISWRAAWAG